MSLFRPVYGESVEVRPKHWWSRKERRSARLAAALCDHTAEQRAKLVASYVTRALITGQPITDAEVRADAERLIRDELR